MAATSPLLAALAQPNYRRYASGNALSLVGTWVQRVAVGWLTWELTHSATWLGIIAIVDLAPAIVMGPLGGAIADRNSPLRITFITQVLAMIAAGLLTVVTALGLMTAPVLALIVFFHGLAMSFNQPARLALVYSLVDRQHLPSAIALNSVVFNTARFIGPAIAGAALVYSGPALAFGINTVSFITFLIALSRIKLEPKVRDRAKSTDSLWADIRDGASYAFSHANIGPLLLFAAVISVSARSYVELLPGFADTVLQGGAATLAILSSAMGIGAVVFGLWLGNRRNAKPTIRFVAGCFALLALTVLGFAFSTSVVLSTLLVSISGGFMTMAGVSMQTYLQLNVDAHYRARLMSLYGIIVRAAPALGALLIGGIADFIGLSWPVAGGAIVALVAALLLFSKDRR